MEEGLRYNEDKLRWSLVDFDALEDMVRVLEFGAEKYTKLDISRLEREFKKWNVKVVEDIEKFEQGDYVTLVTKNNCLMRIQNVKNELGSIKGNIELKIVRGLLSMIDRGTLQGREIWSMQEPKETVVIDVSTESPLKSLMRSQKKGVSYVEKSSLPCKLIITMILEDSEVSFAVNAITVWDSLMTVLKCLNELLGTSKKITNFIVSNGDHNWKSGLKTTEVCESLMRHLHAYMRGEDIDPESGNSHIGHMMCNAMFLSYMHKYKPEFDSRFIDKNK